MSVSVKPSNAVLVQGQSGQLCFVNSSGQLAVDASVTVGSVDASGSIVGIWQGSGYNGVYLTNQSGTLFTVVDLSGRLAVTNSGNSIVSEVSGQYITISGEVVHTWNASGRNIVTIGRQDGTNVVDVSVKSDDSSVAQMLGTYAVQFGYAETQNKINRIRITESGTVASNSGTMFRLLTDTTIQGANLKTGAFVPADDNSGGVALTTNGGITPHGIKLKNYSGEVNSAIHVGSSGNPPYVSGGWILDIGDELHINVNQPDFVRIYARTSGASVCWAGLDF